MTGGRVPINPPPAAGGRFVSAAVCPGVWYRFDAAWLRYYQQQRQSDESRRLGHDRDRSLQDRLEWPRRRRRLPPGGRVIPRARALRITALRNRRLARQGRRATRDRATGRRARELRRPRLAHARARDCSERSRQEGPRSRQDRALRRKRDRSARVPRRRWSDDGHVHDRLSLRQRR